MEKGLNIFMKYNIVVFLSVYKFGEHISENDLTVTNKLSPKEKGAKI